MRKLPTSLHVTGYDNLIDNFMGADSLIRLFGFSVVGVVVNSSTFRKIIEHCYRQNKFTAISQNMDNNNYMLMGVHIIETFNIAEDEVKLIIE